MGKVIILDENTSNKIAAGEVIERPASVVKELVENSIDAGSKNILVEIKNGGISYIKVCDDGEGMCDDDAELAFEQHATSKIRNADDLSCLSTMGFRGEALSSIASVSNIELTTRYKENTYGKFLKIQASVVKECRQTGCPVGTTFIVRDLFHNVPARFKFLKKDSTEAGYISDCLTRLALGNTPISFKLSSKGQTLIHSPGNDDLLSTIFSIYGKGIANELMPVTYQDTGISITGYVGNPSVARSNKNYQSIYINNRYIKSKLISSALEEAYSTFLMKNKHPFAVLHITINPLFVDVNVHPTKMEVRFSREQDVFQSIYHAVSNILQRKVLIKEAVFEQKSNYVIEESIPKKKLNSIKYVQEAIKEVSRPKPEPIIIISKNPQIVSTPEKMEDFNCVANIAANAKIIGQAFLTYILLQLDDSIILVDQHAAHERILYEKIKKNVEDQQVFSQSLISPINIEITHQDQQKLRENQEVIQNLGFNYEYFGNSSVILREVPFLDKISDAKKMFLDVLDILGTHGAKNKEDIYKVACKSALKANKKLDEIEIKELLLDLSRTQNPFTCPHGRPIIANINKYEFERMFKRIV